MRLNYRISLILMLLNVTLLSCVVFDWAITKAYPIHSIDSNKDYEVAWNIDNIRVDYNNRASMIVSSPGQFIIEGWTNETFSSNVLTAINSATGETDWQVPEMISGTIISAGDVIYRGTVGTAYVDAYEAETGTKLWSTLLPWAHSVSDLYYANGEIYVLSADEEFFTLDDDGKILDERHETFRTFLEINGVVYSDENFEVVAFDKSLKRELWRVDITERFTHAPIFDSGEMYLRTWKMPGYVYSIDQSTGKVNWKIEQDLLSNLCVTDERIYFITSDGYLMAIDRFSGEVISKVGFSPSFDLNQNIADYFVSFDKKNNVLAVSFGDSTQIMGLKINTP